MDLVIRAHAGDGPGSRCFEVVERKGLGHPDTICDGIAEHVCACLCRTYLDRFGVILHHNVDKVLLCGGAARPAFGGGEVLEPIEIYLAGRASAEYRGTPIPIHEIAIEACREWMRAHLRGLDVDRHVRIVSRIRPGSGDLTRLFARGRAVPLANDTSCGAGFAPATDLESVVLAVERRLNDPATKASRPELGEDVKVMGIRRDGRIRLTIGCALVGRFVSGLDDYVRKKAGAAALALDAAREVTALPVEALVNVADDLESGDVFLTVTGTSAEAGDDGEVGRGNRVSGLITPYRAMTLEAAAGKNPVSHVGKLYGVVASRIAAAICEARSDVDDATCVLVSQIGAPIDDPQVADVGLVTKTSTSALEGRIAEIVRAELGEMDALRDALIAERISVY